MDFKDFIQVYPNFKDCSIQTFSDKGDKNSPLATHRSVSGINRQSIKDLNDKGAGVFFSVNSMLPGKRDKASVTHLNTWIVESDSMSKEDQRKLIEGSPVKPSCVIESNKSLHIYFFSEDATLENRERVNRGLREYFDGDKALCSDTARVLRLPGSYHNKGEPYKIECKYCEPVKYKESDMLDKFPYTEEIKKEKQVIVKKEQLKKSNVTNYKNIEEFMANQGSRYMLDRVSGSKLVKGERIAYSRNTNGTDQILVDNNASGCWIDSIDYIGSTKGGGPTWIQRCQFYGNTKTDILKWFIEFCDDLIPSHFDRTAQMKAIEKAKQEDIEILKEKQGEILKHISYKDKILRGLDELITTDAKMIMKRGWNEWDDYLGGIYGGKVYIVGADTGVGKTTFVNQVVNNLSSVGVRVTRYSLEDRLEDNAKEEIFYTTNRIRIEKGKSPLDRIPFVNNEYLSSGSKWFAPDVMNEVQEAVDLLCQKDITEIDKTREVGVDDVVGLMNDECDKGTKVFVIDHLHYFEFESSDRQDLLIENAMKKINEVARKRNVAVFIIAHYNATGSKNENGKPTLSAFKGSSSIKQVANIIIQLVREDYDEGGQFESKTFFHVSKIRGPIKKRIIESSFSNKTYEYSFTKSELQGRKERTKFGKKEPKKYTLGDVDLDELF